MPSTALTSPSRQISKATRIAEALFNFVSSFSKSADQFEPSAQVVPVKSVQDWFSTATRKLSANPNYFE